MAATAETSSEPSELWTWPIWWPSKPCFCHPPTNFFQAVSQINVWKVISGGYANKKTKQKETRSLYWVTTNSFRRVTFRSSRATWQVLTAGWSLPRVFSLMARASFSRLAASLYLFWSLAGHTEQTHSVRMGDREIGETAHCLVWHAANVDFSWTVPTVDATSAVKCLKPHCNWGLYTHRMDKWADEICGSCVWGPTKGEEKESAPALGRILWFGSVSPAKRQMLPCCYRCVASLGGDCYARNATPLTWEGDPAVAFEFWGWSHIHRLEGSYDTWQTTNNKQRASFYETPGRLASRSELLLRRVSHLFKSMFRQIDMERNRDVDRCVDTAREIQIYGC